MDKEIYIYFDDVNTDNPLFVGILLAQQVRGREVFSFQFDEKAIGLKTKTDPG